MSPYQHDEVRAAYDVIAEEYLRRVTQANDATELRAQLDSYITMLKKRVPEGGKIVDLGCGAGLPITVALAETFDVAGVDFSIQQIELARKNVPGATFVQADMSEVSFPEGSIDGVTAFFSIIHVHRDLHAQLFMTF